jgi:hypothetical protein
MNFRIEVGMNLAVISLRKVVPLASSGTSASWASNAGLRPPGLRGRLRAGEFLVVERQAAVFLVHRDQALGEAVLGDGHRGALLAGQGQVVERFAR